MYRYLILLLSFGVNAHQFTPTYPTLAPSVIEGILKVNMQILNKREDVRYYELEVLDENSNPIPFSAAQKIIPVDYLERKDLEIYVREKDKNRVTYICSISKIEKGSSATVSSRICSKIVR